MIDRVICYTNKTRNPHFTIIRVSYFLFTVGLIFLTGTKLYSQNYSQAISSAPMAHTGSDDGLWNGPILFHEGTGEPVHLILVEKALQKLFLYRYDGRYQLIRSYDCSTGEKRGKKREENDEKTPEGIYFNVKAYRDSKITVFGDRAFGLNYPDVFDDVTGNKGSGIFIHGSNRDIMPFSTNGCIVLSNLDLADLDKRTQLKKTPVIIGKHLPYLFESRSNNITELIPLFKQLMLPEGYIALNPEFHYITVLKYQDRIVAIGEIRTKEPKGLLGFSRLYLAKPGKNLLILIKREWSEF